MADGAAVDAVTCRSSTAAPSPRGDSTGVVDPTTGYLWIMGGDVGSTMRCVAQPEFAADTWRYEPECDRWTAITIDPAPSARGRAAAALDSRRRRMLMFGGRYRDAGTTGNYTLNNEVWALDLANERWELLQATGTAPSARANASAAYDADADELVIFGGNTSRAGLSFAPQSDTWALNLGTLAWRRVATTGTAPMARLFHAAAIRDGHMVVVDGGGANAFMGPFYNDAYSLELATGAWSRITLSGENALGRINAVLVADPTTPRFLLVAGHDDGRLGNRNDVLALPMDGAVGILSTGDAFNHAGAGFCDFPADFVTTDMDAPERRSAFVAGIDPTHSRVIVFGGKTDCGVANDIWTIELPSGRWRPLHTTNEGVSCARGGRSGCTSLCQ